MDVNSITELQPQTCNHPSRGACSISTLSEIHIHDDDGGGGDGDDEDNNYHFRLSCKIKSKGYGFFFFYLSLALDAPLNFWVHNLLLF